MDYINNKAGSMKKAIILSISIFSLLMLLTGCPDPTSPQESQITPGPTAEATAEGTPEPTIEGSPEPTADGTPEPTTEGSPEPTADGSPEPTPGTECGIWGEMVWGVDTWG
jgi:hypothetical protein